METKVWRPRRWMWVGLGLLLLAWLVPAGFVALYGPRVQEESSALEATIDDVLSGGGTDVQPLFSSRGYVKSWRIETWKGAASADELPTDELPTDELPADELPSDELPTDRHRAAYLARRGPLDREAGTFPFSLRCTLNHAEDVEGMRLFVTSASPWPHSNDASWKLVQEVRVPKPGAASVTLLCSGDVRASATAYRLQEIRAGVVCGGFSRSMLTAPTALGRAYDALAWRPAFRWLPALR